MLAAAASMLEQVDSIRRQVDTSDMDKSSSTKYHQKLDTIAQQVPAIMTKVKEINVEDHRQYSIMIMVCKNKILVFC